MEGRRINALLLNKVGAAKLLEQPARRCYAPGKCSLYRWGRVFAGQNQPAAAQGKRP